MNTFHYIVHFFIIRVAVPEPGIFFWIPAYIAGAAAVIPNRAKKIFANRTATFINRPANLLNNEPKGPPGWIISDIWALNSFISVDVLFSYTFLSLVFFLLIIINEVNFFLQAFWYSFLKLLLSDFC